MFGVSHKTAPVDVREAAALSAGETEYALRHLRDTFDVDGVLVISTCNRTEVYASGENSNTQIPGMRAWMDDYKGCDCFANERYTYVLRNSEAIKHFFLVISSLDSQIIGEPQITGQVKDAYNLARDNKTTGALINKLVETGLRAQKKVRSDTFLVDGAVSVSFAGVELARKIFNQLDDKRILLVGAGETAELAARHFADRGVREINILNRTVEKARELAGSLGGNAFEFDQLPTALEIADIVISATSSREYIINAGVMGAICKHRHYEPVFLIDLAVPRDIDPDVDGLDGIYLYNLDDLNDVVAMNIEKRKQEIPRATKIVERYVSEFLGWMSTHTMSSTISSIKKYFENLRQGELARLRKRLPEEGIAEVDYLTQSIMNKLMHQHIKTLKGGSSDPVSHQQHIDFLRKLYDLDREKS
jgi:glutamyl-tRNA reductase